MTASAEEIVADVESRSRRYETPCNDGTIVWHVWGSGPPLLLFHGSQGSWSHWIRNVDALAGSRSVWAVDLPGQGDSAMTEIEEHAAFSRVLAEGIDQLMGGETSVDMAGFSFGGVVATYLAAFHPQLVRRVIIIGSGGLDTPVGHVDIRRASGLKGAEREAVLRHNLLQIMLHHPESVDELALHLLTRNARRSRLDVAPRVLPDKLLQILPEVRCQVDGIWGELDRVHYDAWAQLDALRTIKPDAEMRVIPDAGHWVMYERAEAFNRALLDMLNTPLRSGR